MRISRALAMLSLLIVAVPGAGAFATPLDTGWLTGPLGGMLRDSQDLCCLGWNAKGVCALSQTIDSGMRGGYAMRLLVLDMVADAVVFDAQGWADELGVSSGGPEDFLKALVSSDVGRKFMDVCNQKGIDATAGAARVLPFPLAYKGTTLSATMKSAASKEPPTDSQKEDFGRGARKLDLQVLVQRGSGGSKIITTKKNVMASSFEVVGYFLSPFEPRALVVFETTAPGFEGDSLTTYGFSGCHLEVGYK